MGALGGDVGPAVLLGEAVGEVGLGGVAQAAAVQDADRGVRAHDPDLRARPGEHEAGAEVLGVHRDVGAAVGLAQHDGEALDGGGGEGVHELGAVADDAGALLAAARHEARGVDEAPAAGPRSARRR